MKLNKQSLVLGFITVCVIVLVAVSGWYFGYKLPKQKRMNAAIVAINAIYDDVFGEDKIVEEMCQNYLIKPGITHTLDEIIASGYICKCVAETNRIDFVKSILSLARSGQKFTEENINNLKNMPKEPMLDISITLCSGEYESKGRDYFINKYGVIK